RHLVAGCRFTVGPAFDSEESDVGHVVLAAGVGAAGDVHADTADLGQARVFQRPPNVGRQAARLRDGQVAGVGARAADDVTRQLGAGLGHADGVEAGIQGG